jgi:hypothetical protein
MTADDSRDKDAAPKPSPSGTAGAGSGSASATPATPAAAAAGKAAAPVPGAPPSTSDKAAPAQAKPAAEAAVAAVKAAAPQPPTPPRKPQPADEFDPIGWEVPIICKDCNKGFTVPYRHFHAGVVFHCPACQGSWVPNTTIARVVRHTFEKFWSERKRSREAFARGELKIERAEFERRQAAELKEFKERLERQARELKPAGKLVRPKGLAAMFT